MRPQYHERLGYSLQDCCGVWRIEHWSGSNVETFKTRALALRAIESAKRISPELAREIMASVNASDLGDLALSIEQALPVDTPRLAEAYTVLSAANMPEARAYFAGKLPSIGF